MICRPQQMPGCRVRLLQAGSRACGLGRVWHLEFSTGRKTQTTPLPHSNLRRNPSCFRLHPPHLDTPQQSGQEAHHSRHVQAHPDHGSLPERGPEGGWACGDCLHLGLCWLQACAGCARCNTGRLGRGVHMLAGPGCTGWRCNSDVELP